MGVAQAQPGPQGAGVCPDMHPDDMMPLCWDEQPLEFASAGACYIPWLDGVVLIDSVECSINFLVREGDTMRCCGTYVTDNILGRHDLPKIVRPKSLGILGDCIVLLASSAGDSAFLALLPLNVDKEKSEMKPCAVIGFNSSAYAFQILPDSKEILVMGKNALGYDIYYVSFDDDMATLTLSSKCHYHVPRQAERIQSSDPSGVGLTVVAVVVVFLLLACICFIMKGFASSATKVQNRSGKQSAASTGVAATATANSTEEVYAAIAAAIYTYNEELHDEENTVITIQKVERSWTPWNAKFYNMNKYFNNRR